MDTYNSSVMIPTIRNLLRASIGNNMPTGTDKFHRISYNYSITVGGNWPIINTLPWAFTIATVTQYPTRNSGALWALLFLHFRTTKNLVEKSLRKDMASQIFLVIVPIMLSKSMRQAQSENKRGRPKKLCKTKIHAWSQCGESINVEMLRHNFELSDNAVTRRINTDWNHRWFDTGNNSIINEYSQNERTLSLPALCLGRTPEYFKSEQVKS